jgi:hypothetical protein
LPKIKSGHLKKLGIAKGDNLNEFLYRRLYSGGGIGETTSLLIGEAAANSLVSGLFWSVSALIVLVLICWSTSRFMDIGVLIGIAAWRGSMGGLFDVFPALVLQVVFCALLVLWRINSSRVPSMTTKISLQ